MPPVAPPHPSAASGPGRTAPVPPDLDVDALAGAVRAPLASGPGQYSVTVALHPADLGPVRAQLALRGDALSVVVTAAVASGHEALAAALPGLREQLAASGLTVDVQLGTPPGDTPGGGRPQTGPSDTSRPARATGTDPTTDPAPPAAPTADGRIHLVL
jgi:hypothetical protein